MFENMFMVVYFFMGLTAIFAVFQWLEFRKLLNSFSKPLPPKRRDEFGVRISEWDRWGELDEELIDNETPESRRQAAIFERTLPQETP